MSPRSASHAVAAVARASSGAGPAEQRAFDVLDALADVVPHVAGNVALMGGTPFGGSISPNQLTGVKVFEWLLPS